MFTAVRMVGFVLGLTLLSTLLISLLRQASAPLLVLALTVALIATWLLLLPGFFLGRLLAAVGEGSPAGRFFIYSLVGGQWGIADWFFIYLLRLVTFSYFISSPSYPAYAGLGNGLNLAVWLIPALLVAAAEARRARHWLPVGLAVATTWAGAVVIYYLFYAAIFAAGGAGLFQSAAAGDGAFAALLPKALKWGAAAIGSGPVVGSLMGVLLVAKRQQRGQPLRA